MYKDNHINWDDFFGVDVPEFNFPVFTNQDYNSLKEVDKERERRAKHYANAFQEQLEIESMQEGKIGQKKFPIDDEERIRLFRETRKEIRWLPTADFCPDN